MIEHLLHIALHRTQELIEENREKNRVRKIQEAYQQRVNYIKETISAHRTNLTSVTARTDLKALGINEKAKASIFCTLNRHFNTSYTPNGITTVGEILELFK